MKKLFIFVIILSFLFTGCISENNEGDSEENGGILDEPSEKLVVPIIYPTYFFDGYTNMSSLQLDKWEQHLSELSGADISIDYVDAGGPRKSMASEFPDKGLVYIWDLSVLKLLVENGKVVPLNDFVKGLENYGAIGEDVLSCFTDRQGNLWGLPSGYGPVFTYTRYNQDILDELGLEIPKTLSDYEKAGRLFQEKYETEKVKYLLNITRSDTENLFYINNIFTAFGCYPNIRGIQNIIYDPVESRYCDMVFTDEFKEAVSYIKYLIDSGLALYVDDEAISKIRKTFEFLSGPMLDDGSKVGVGFSLAEEKEANCYYEIPNAQGFAVLKDTGNIRNILNFLLTGAYADEELRDAFNYGVEGYHFSNEGNYYLRKEDTDKNLVALNPILINIFNYPDEKFLFSRQLPEEEMNKLMESRKKSIERYNEILTNNKDKIYVYDQYSSIVHEHEEMEILEDEAVVYPIDVQISMNFSKMLQDIFSGEMPIDTAIEFYESSFNEMEYENYMAYINTEY